MKKLQQDRHSKSIKDLEKDVASMRHDIAKVSLELRVSPVKDTNVIKKKKSELARTLTVISSKRQEKDTK